MERELPRFLPDFPNTSIVGELRFHLKELYWDLGNIILQTGELRSILFDESVKTQDLRRQLASIAYQIEHDVQEHASKALAVSQALREPNFLETLESVAICSDHEQNALKNQSLEYSAEQAREQLDFEVGHMQKNLEEALAIVNLARSVSSTKLSAVERLEEYLRSLTDLLELQCLPQGFRSLALVTYLDRLINPKTAIEEDQLEELDVPLQEFPCEQARYLAQCPRCGAALGSLDRTFRGSYCEACRTNWYAP